MTKIRKNEEEMTKIEEICLENAKEFYEQKEILD